MARKLRHPMDRIDDRLRELGLTLYGPHPPHDPLDAVVVHGGIARTSGQLPRIDGELTCLGVLGADVTVEEGYEAAKVCALNALAVLKAELGSLDRIQRILTVTGYVASAPGFDQQPAVVDGASHVFLGCCPVSLRDSVVGQRLQGGQIALLSHQALLERPRIQAALQHRTTVERDCFSQ